jgi:hypothetical protein
LRRPLGLAVHWIGPAVPPAVERAERDAVARFLEGVRRFHVSTNGWSDIAYQVAVDQAGREWTCRGFGRRSAANGDAVVNARYGAVVALIGQGQQPTPAMLRGLAHARERFRDRHPTGDKLLTHNDVRPEPTACPGPQLTSWVHDAHGRPPAPPTPVLIDPAEESTMVLIVHPNGSAYHLTSKGLVWLEASEVSRISGQEPTVVHVDNATWEAYRDGFGVLKAK